MRLAVAGLIVGMMGLALVSGYVGYRIGDRMGFDRAVVASLTEKRWDELSEESVLIEVAGPGSNLSKDVAPYLDSGWRVKAVYPRNDRVGDRILREIQVFHLVK